MSLKEKSKLLKPLKSLENEKICKGIDEKEDVEKSGKKRKINLDDDEIVGKVNEGSDKEKNQNNKLDEDVNKENVEFPKNQNAENVPKNQTAGKKGKINLDEDEKEYVEGDLDDNAKKIKKMQMKNQNCKTPPPPPPPTKGLSNFFETSSTN